MKKPKSRGNSKWGQIVSPPLFTQRTSAARQPDPKRTTRAWERLCGLCVCERGRWGEKKKRDSERVRRRLWMSRWERESPLLPPSSHSDATTASRHSTLSHCQRKNWGQRGAWPPTACNTHAHAPLLRGHAPHPQLAVVDFGLGLGQARRFSHVRACCAAQNDKENDEKQ